MVFIPLNLLHISPQQQSSRYLPFDGHLGAADFKVKVKALNRATNCAAMEISLA